LKTIALIITAFLAASPGTLRSATAGVEPETSNQKTESKLEQAEKKTVEAARETKDFLKAKTAETRRKIEKANRRKIKTTIKVEAPQARHARRSERPQSEK
jgi:hypothetical protein